MEARKPFSNPISHFQLLKFPLNWRKGGKESVGIEAPYTPPHSVASNYGSSKLINSASFTCHLLVVKISSLGSDATVEELSRNKKSRI